MKSLVVLQDGNEYEIDIDARDRRAFERQKDIVMPKAASLREQLALMPETYLVWLAYNATRRKGILDGKTYEVFESEVLEVRSLEESDDDGLDPTQQTATGGSSRR